METTTDKSLDQLFWIRELVKSEENLEQTGVIDLHHQQNSEKELLIETLHFLQSLKNKFIETSSAFNELKSSALGRVKIYGIAKTHSDFMLFRNGFKMIFSLKEAGQISIRFNFLGPNPGPSQLPSMGASAIPMMEEHLLEAKVGPFGEVNWTFRNHSIQLNSVVKFHLSLFIRESAK